MAVDPADPDFAIGIVGTGTMGRGIAQIAAAGGYKVRLFDSRPGAADEARTFVMRMLARAVERGSMTQAASEAAVSHIAVIPNPGGFLGCGLVVEAIVEDLEIKRALFAELEGIVGPECVLATNTSSLSVTAIAGGCKTPGRVAGYHFFNPVPLLRVVEVVEGLLTEPWVAPVLETVAKRCGHTPVRAKDTPGFLVNHAGRGLYTEGLRIAAEGIAAFHDVDDVLREGGAGFRMGPFELMDTTGLDVSGVVMESIYQQFYDEPRFRPVYLTRQRMAAGLYGRKTNRGYYRYADGKKVAPEPLPVPDARPESVWLWGEAEGRKALESLFEGKTEIVTGQKPRPDSICILAPLGADATTAALAAGTSPERSVAVDTLFGLDGRRTLMTTPVTRPEARAAAHGLLAADGVPVTVIHDSPGFIAQRVAATIVNIGCEIAQMRIATPSDIDKAVKLGLAYPRGPIELGDWIGPRRVLGILEALHDFYKDPRYRPSPWLVRRARLGVPLSTAES
jgi:3-hydroxybutyryl-CoA dehydrogenase